MHINQFIIIQDGKVIGNVTVRERAVNAAKTRASETGKPASVVAHLDNGRDREVIFNPDGTEAIVK